VSNIVKKEPSGSEKVARIKGNIEGAAAGVGTMIVIGTVGLIPGLLVGGAAYIAWKLYSRKG
jgi:hypothetical protein